MPSFKSNGLPVKKPTTHTSLTGEAIFITPKENDSFMRWYYEKNNRSVVHTLKDDRCILIDFDIVAPSPPGGDKTTAKAYQPQRMYSSATIETILNQALAVLHKMTGVKKGLRIYLLEKGKVPRSDPNKGWKDGFHIMIPDIRFKKSIMECFRKEVILRLKEIIGKGSCPEFTTPNITIDNIDSVYDGNVNSWFMYGSKKPSEPLPFKVTKKYTALYDDAADINRDFKLVLQGTTAKRLNAPEEYVEDFYQLIQNLDLNVIGNLSPLNAPYNSGMQAIPSRGTKALFPANVNDTKETKGKKKVQIEGKDENENEEKDENENEEKDEEKDEKKEKEKEKEKDEDEEKDIALERRWFKSEITLNIIDSLIDMTSPSRFDDRAKWISMGMIIRRSLPDGSAFPLFVKWSSRSPKFISETDCYSTWSGFGDGPLSFWKLLVYAKEDEPHKYFEWKRNIVCHQLALIRDKTLSLHTANITWDEEYEQQEMRDYPANEPLVVVKAGMGTGKTKAALREVSALPEGSRVLIITYGQVLACKYKADTDLCYEQQLRLAKDRYEMRWGEKWDTQWTDEALADEDFISTEEEKFLKSSKFVNYLDRKGALTEDRVIVCLDSLLRVDISHTFDYVMLDEGVSVMNHLLSPYMDNRNIVCDALRKVLVSCNKVRFIDAYVDDTSMQSFIGRLGEIRSQKVYNIWNRYVRVRDVSSNHMTVIVNPIGCNFRTNKSTSDGGEGEGKGKGGDDVESSLSLEEAFLTHVVSVLFKGGNVVCPVSKKSTLEKLEKFIRSYPEIANIDMACYTSETDRKIIMQDSLDTNTTWRNLRLVAYTPTISAGVSYELPTFHEKIAFFVNSPETAGVDICVQQTMRVRQMLSKTTVYIQTPINKPVLQTVQSVETSLAQHQTWMKEMCPDNEYFLMAQAALHKHHDPDTQDTIFDRKDMLYPIFVGSVVRKSMSGNAFIDMFVNAMRDDVGFDVRCELFKGGFRDQDDDHLNMLKGRCKAKEPLTRVVPDECDLRKLYAKRKRQSERGLEPGEERITDEEKQMILNFKLCSMRDLDHTMFPVSAITGKHEIPDPLMPFFANVMNPRAVDESYDKVHLEEVTKGLLADTLAADIADNLITHIRDSDTLLYEFCTIGQGKRNVKGKSKDGDADILGKSERAHLCMTLMRHAFGPEFAKRLREDGRLNMDRKEFQAKVLEHIQAMSPSCATEFSKTFAIRKMDALMLGDAKSMRRVVEVAKKIFSKAVGITYLSPLNGGKRNTICFTTGTYLDAIEAQSHYRMPCGPMFRHDKRQVVDDMCMESKEEDEKTVTTKTVTTGKKTLTNKSKEKEYTSAKNIR
jgi:Origin of replication binding protein/Primase C terminal 2 (PriCT-2)